MKKFLRLFCIVLSVAMIAGLGACSKKDDDNKTEEKKNEETKKEEKKTDDKGQKDTSSDEKKTDKELADEVAALIDAIYVQERTDKTDEQCAQAKAAWDKLTDAQKELVEGEEADPDYFGRDTGDAGKDDPRNADDIGKKELLVVSFGTSFNDSRAMDIKGIEDALAKEFADWSVRRAFTAQIIINHVQARDGEKIDNVEQALDRAVNNGVEVLVIQPTHLMHGAEYDELKEAVDKYTSKIKEIIIAEPLLGQVGNDATVINDDKKAVATALTAAAVKDAGYASLDEAAQAGTAFVFMGHGTSHTAKVSYSQMQTQMENLGYKNVFIGTVEGEPESTACEEVIKAVAGAGYKNVVLRPLMVVAGDHANNDMAGEDEDSWVNMFKASGSFEKVDVQITGLGRLEDIQTIYIAHSKAAVDSVKNVPADKSTEGTVSGELEDGIYTADFNTDGSMFHVNEAYNGKGVLTVKDGKMTIHVSLPSKNTVNLFYGLAEDAKKEGADLIQPTTDTVHYPDGTTEEVNGFDIPVPYLDKEFDCALVGTKGKWYDHKVSVSSPAATVKDGSYKAEVTLSGGTGKASVESPAKLEVENGIITATVVWSSSNYEYINIGETRYDRLKTDGNSTFKIPVKLDEDIKISALTTAMSEPHLIDYTLRFDGATIQAD